MEREERLELRRRGQTLFLVFLLEEIRKDLNNTHGEIHQSRAENFPSEARGSKAG